MHEIQQETHQRNILPHCHKNHATIPNWWISLDSLKRNLLNRCKKQTVSNRQIHQQRYHYL